MRYIQNFWEEISLNKKNLIIKIRFIYKIEVANMKKVFSNIYILTAVASLFNIVRAQIRVYITESFYSEIHNKQITACYSFKPFETDIDHLFQICLSNPI
jgi:hypothetical protein